MDVRFSPNYYAFGANSCTKVQGDVLVVYVYQLRKDANGEESVGVEKVSFRKNAASLA